MSKVLRVRSRPGVVFANITMIIVDGPSAITLDVSFYCIEPNSRRCIHIREVSLLLAKSANYNNFNEPHDEQISQSRAPDAVSKRRRKSTKLYLWYGISRSQH